METRETYAHSSRLTRNDVDAFLEGQAALAARECGRFDQQALASAFGWHQSNGYRAMNGDATGGRYFANTFGGLFRLSTHPKTDGWPVLARGRIVVKRAKIGGAATETLRADFWRHMDGRKQAERDAYDALLERDGRKFADAEARRSAEADAVAAHLTELLDRGVDPLAEGRPR